MTRQKEFELQAADARRRWESMRRRESERSRYYSPAEMANTLGPQEDVVESRRSRRNRVVMAAPRAGTKGILMENIILLILLIASIYGLYLLSIHILNQS